MPDYSGQYPYLIATGFSLLSFSLGDLLLLHQHHQRVMAIQCAAAAKLALPTILRSVFRSEPPRDLRAPPVRHLVRLSKHQHARSFYSASRLHQLQVGQLHDVTTESRSHTTMSTPEPGSGTADSDATSHETAIASLTEPSTEVQKHPKKDHSRKGSDKDKKVDTAKKTLKKKKKKPEGWQIQKQALEKKFPGGWNPPKKLSPDALEGIRHLHATAPDRFTTAVLAEEFKVSPEAIRRILKSRWRPSEDEMESRRQRWEKRHERIWSQMVELGLRPPSQSSKPLLDSNSLYRKGKK